MARDNLDSAEKFFLGGESGVRAYPASEAGGADGHLLNLELRLQMPEGFRVTAFYDHGRVRVNHDNAAAVNPNIVALKGRGLALAWRSDFGLELKATWAQRIGENPNPTATGNDQDGSKIHNRFWFTAKLPF